MRRVNWRRSTKSGTNGENCVELVKLSTAIGARDSKNPDGLHHRFSVDAMTALFADIKRGRYDLT